MNIKLILIAMVLAVAVAGCGKKEGAGGESATGSTEQTTQPPAAGVAEKMEKAATESKEVIEGNVESIEENIEKSEDQSTITPEQLKESEVKESEAEKALPQSSAGVVEEEVDIDEEQPAAGNPSKKEAPAEQKSSE